MFNFLHFLVAQGAQTHLKEKYVWSGCHVYQYMAIIALKCLLSISWLGTSALHRVNINKVLLLGVATHLRRARCRFEGNTARTDLFIRWRFKSLLFCSHALMELRGVVSVL